jgi:hypothetical protein
MKSLSFLFILFGVSFLGCNESESLTGDVLVNIGNTMSFDIDISAGIYFEEDDSEPFTSKWEIPIVKGGVTEYSAENILPGNYYFICLYKDTESNNWAGAKVVPIQVLGGKGKEIFVNL